MSARPIDELAGQTFVPSTTWEWRCVKLREATPEAPVAAARAKRGRLVAFRSRWRPITIQVSYSGGAESWWRITARGTSWFFPGHRALEDVMKVINRD